MQESEKGEAALSVFDELRAVARRVDHEMATLRRGRRDLVAFVQHDAEPTVLAMRAEIDELRRRAEAALNTEQADGTALHGLVSAATAFTEERRGDLDAMTAYLAQYGYEPPPPPPPPEEEAPEPEKPEEAAEREGPKEPGGSVARPPPMLTLDTPEDVQLSEMTVQMLRGTVGQLGATEDDTGDATALLNFGRIALPPLAGSEPPAEPTRKRVPWGASGTLESPKLSETTRAMLHMGRAKPATPSPELSCYSRDLLTRDMAPWGDASSTLQSPELSEATRAMLARRCGNY
ncbi:drebrin-like [Pollicipes pollicipes]|uniref:drebrin-like n=1 Tax=Pollicipes pollicipes TaxID=41117 RepID=UPI0018849526|nr:drebrin-like [Pollicipes pollicipes]